MYVCILIVFLSAYLSRLEGDCPAMVRVYSSAIEQDDFPLPLDSIKGRRHSKYVKNSDIAKYALHQMLRDPRECPYANNIRDLDKEIRKCLEDKRDLSREEKKIYVGLIRVAKLEIIQKKEIILCTCHASAWLFKEGINIKQVCFSHTVPPLLVGLL